MSTENIEAAPTFGDVIAEQIETMRAANAELRKINERLAVLEQRVFRRAGGAK